MALARRCAMAAAMVVLCSGAGPITYTLPDAAPDPLPHTAEADLVRANCSGCHSLDYIVTQPRGKGAQFWTDEVNKMTNVYKAPIAPDDSAKIAATLGGLYGTATN